MVLSMYECDLTDGAATAAVFTSTITPLMKYQNGSASIDSVREYFAHQHRAALQDIHMGQSGKVYLKVVDHDITNDSGEATMIAWADWEVPEDESVAESSDALPGTPPPGMNYPFSFLANRATQVLRNRVLKDRKCYILNQLVTLPEHQRRGAGTMLLTWPFECADKDGTVCYVEAEADSKVMAFYEKHGFVKVDEHQVALSVCRLAGFYTLVAMVREPRPEVWKEES